MRAKHPTRRAQRNHDRRARARLRGFPRDVDEVNPEVARAVDDRVAQRGEPAAQLVDDGNHLGQVLELQLDGRLEGGRTG